MSRPTHVAKDARLVKFLKSISGTYLGKIEDVKVGSACILVATHCKWKIDPEQTELAIKLRYPYGYRWTRVPVGLSGAAVTPCLNPSGHFVWKVKWVEWQHIYNQANSYSFCATGLFEVLSEPQIIPYSYWVNRENELRNENEPMTAWAWLESKGWDIVSDGGIYILRYPGHDDIICYELSQIDEVAMGEDWAQE